MNASEWSEVERVLAEIIELPKAERAGRLQHLCDGNIELRAEVESLLAAHDSADSFLEAGGENTPQPIQAFSMAGKHLGPYQLKEVIGRGGMGTVYRAERTDGRFQKQVAIKVTPAALHSPELLRRFSGEQQILAKLEHPNISQLFDAGVSPEGIPYFVMEHVEGKPLNGYCEAQQLSVRQRLELFQSICAAVNYAHQHLVVHRDIKPGNILVTSDGVPKLLDFGIARIADEMRVSADGATQSLLNPMTPGYASPEQVSGNTITTASDIYSLGVVLYELLTGQRPYEIAGKPFGEAMRIVTEKEPEKPSAIWRSRQKETKASAGSSRMAWPDLDAIVAKAMRKDPQQRYASPSELSSDISRYLSGLPVLAQRGSFRYVATKFVTRHKLAVLASTAALTLAAAGVVTIVWQARIAQRERAKAQRRFDQVRTLANSLMFDVHDNIVTLPGSTEARRLIITKALAYLDSLAKESEGDASLQMELAAAYYRVGNLQYGGAGEANLGDSAGALASYEKAQGVLTSVLAREPNRKDASQYLALLYGTISNVYARLRRIEEARTYADKALTVWEPLAASSPNDERIQSGLAGAYGRLADAIGQENSDEGLVPRGKELAIFASLLERNPRSPEAMRNVALSEKMLADTLLRLRRYSETIAHLEHARDLDAQRAATNANNTLAKLDLTFDLSEIAQVYSNQQQPRKALEYMQQVLAIRQSLVDADPKDIRTKGRLAFALLRLGYFHLQVHEYADALTNYHSSIKINEALNDPEATSEGALAYLGVGDAESGLGDSRQINASRRAAHRQAACSAYHNASKRYDDLKRRGAASQDDLQDGATATRLTESCDKGLRVSR